MKTKELIFFKMATLEINLINLNIPGKKLEHGQWSFVCDLISAIFCFFPKNITVCIKCHRSFYSFYRGDITIYKLRSPISLFTKKQSSFRCVKNPRVRTPVRRHVARLATIMLFSLFERVCDFKQTFRIILNK